MAAITVFNQAPSPTQINAGAANNALLSTAMTNTKNYDGTEAVGTAMALVFTAGTGGAQLPKLRVRYASTNGAAASGTTAATVVRFWANNGIANTTATNNIFLGEMAVPSATMSQTALSYGTELNYDFGLLTVPAGYRIYAGLATAIGGTNCALAVNMLGGGDFA